MLRDPCVIDFADKIQGVVYTIKSFDELVLQRLPQPLFPRIIMQLLFSRKVYMLVRQYLWLVLICHVEMHQTLGIHRVTL